MFERQKSFAAAGKFLWPIWDKGLKKRIHRITAPTLIVWGDHDGIVPRVRRSSTEQSPAPGGDYPEPRISSDREARGVRPHRQRFPEGLTGRVPAACRWRLAPKGGAVYYLAA
jgi:hypothetical protein